MLNLINKWAFGTGSFLLITVLLAGTGLQAQVTDLNQTINAVYDKVPLETILQELTRNTHIRFSYSANLIQSGKKITCDAVNQPLKQVLDEIFRQAEIHYEVVNGYFVLTPNHEEQVTRSKEGREKFTISGTIVDSAGREVMIGAAVYIRESGLGAITNNYGFYSLTLPRGVYTLQTSFLGYSVESKYLELNNDITWNIHIKPVAVQMKEIIINSPGEAERVFNERTSQINVDPAAVQRQSAALGETDLLKSLDNLPGISFQSDGSSYFSVRGGNHDQNLILLDDAPIYNPSHLLGLFTPVIPEAIKHTEIYRADFPVQYGGRLSSVIDIRAHDGNMSHFSGSASVSPVSSRFSVEGPLKKDASSYFVSFRGSTFGLLVKANNPSVENFYFTDFTSKFNLKLGQRDRLYLTLFAGKDVFINKPGTIRNGLTWGNSAATLRWSHIYGSKIFSNTTLYASKYDYSLYTNYDEKLFWNSDITSTNLKSEFSWYINPNNSLKFGLNLGGYFFNPGNYNSPDPALDTMKVSEVNSGELVLYAGNDLKPLPWLQIIYGVRLSNWSNYGEAFTIVYDEDHKAESYIKYSKGTRYYSKTFLEPRISLSVRTGRYASIKASFNRTTQHINQISNSISPFNSLEVWLPSGPNLKPQYANIFDVGYVCSWAGHAIELSLDAYYKRMFNQLGYQNHAEMFLNPFLEGELRQGDGYAKGFEIMLRKTQGRFTGQLGYGYVRSTLQIDALNRGKSYPSHQDKPIDISFWVDYRVRPRWAINMSINYTSGMALSTPTGFYNYQGTQIPVYDRQNNDRLPDYKRVDLGTVWRLNKADRTFEHYLTFTLYNFFSTRNYAFLNFNKIKGDDGKFYVPADKLNRTEQLVTFRYVYSLVPSITYNLKF
jgi:hypothetical protein